MSEHIEFERHKDVCLAYEETIKELEAKIVQLKWEHDNQERILRSIISSKNSENLATFNDFHKKIEALKREKEALCEILSEEFNRIISTMRPG